MIRILCSFCVVLTVAPNAFGQILSYPNTYMDYVYPAGGRQGQTVSVEFGAIGGLEDAKSILIDGPPGIAVTDVKAVSGSLVKATFTIASNAIPGRRFVRVAGGSNGLTNFRYFFVGNMPEVMEKESNDTPTTAQEVTAPVVVNGRIEKELDVDCYRFSAKAGQRYTLAVQAHAMDSVVRIANIQGYLDTSLELLDEQGKVLAAADDTIGLDPVLDYTFKTDGRYVVRVQSLSFKGAVSAVYRLTIGDVPYPTAVFPPGGQRGTDVDVHITGLNLGAGNRQKVQIPAAGSFPVFYLPPGDGPTSGFDLPLIRGEHPEVVEVEPNNDASKAMRVPFPVVINGRIDRTGDEDWYRVSLKKGQAVVFEVTAQRFLRSPIDTFIEVYDAAGKKLAENDDGALFAPQCAGDFPSADSWLPFTAPADGDYLVRLRDQTGVSGPDAVYRLTIKDLRPALAIYQWPDAVPIWGAGTTASFLVELYHWGLTSDVELRVEGLPEGWTGSSTKLSLSAWGVYTAPTGYRALLTITAPANAVRGTTVPFRVVGKTQHDGRTFEQEAQYLTLYGNGPNKRMFLRNSPTAHAVVAGFMDAWPTTTVKELTITEGETVMIPVQIQRNPATKRTNIGVVVNGPTVAASVGLGAPVTVKADQDTIMVPVTIGPRMFPGTRGIVLARSWSSDIRGGRPGPCTPIIILHVRSKEK